MKKGRRYSRVVLFVFLMTAILSIEILSVTAEAEEGFPKSSIEFVVCYPPGGGGDIMARTVAPTVEKILKVPIYIMNKPGGEGGVGVSYMLNKKPDGYTLFGIHQFNSFVGAALGELLYDPKEIYEICNLISIPTIFAVQKSSPFQTIKELLDAARKNPGKLKYGVPSLLTAQGISAELFKLSANVDIVPVPFKGSGPAMIALLGGHVDLVSVPYATAKPHIQAGTVRALVVFGKKRLDEMPEIPSAVDLGYEEAPMAIGGVGTSAKVSMDRIERISRAFRDAMKDPNLLIQLKKVGLEPAYMNHEDFLKHNGEGYEKVRKIKDKLLNY